MQPAKPFYLSKTLLGAIMMAVAMACRFCQLDAPQSELDAAGAALDQAVEGISGLVGFGLVIYGRLKAKHALTLSANPEE